MSTIFDIRIGSVDGGKEFKSSFDEREPECSHKLRCETINEAYEEWNRTKGNIFVSINWSSYREISVETFLYYKDMFEKEYKKFLDNKVPYKETYADFIHNMTMATQEHIEDRDNYKQSGLHKAFSKR